MRRVLQTVCVVFVALLVGLGASFSAGLAPPGAVLVIQGKILDSAGNPLGEASNTRYLNGKRYMDPLHRGELSEASVTGKNARFRLEIPAPPDKITHGKWSVKVTRPSFKPSPFVLSFAVTRHSPTQPRIVHARRFPFTWLCTSLAQ